MRTSINALLGLALLATAAPALAQEETDPPSPITINGTATLVSDYRFRGISQTNKDFAVQGSLTVTHESGLYVSVWGSSIDDYVAGGSDQEIDLIAGFKTTTEGGTTFDIGVLYYYYPGSNGANSDFVEPYVAVSHTFGPVGAKLLAAYAPKQKALTIGAGSEDNLYLALDLSAAIPNTPLSITGHIGHSFGPSYLTIGDEYTDWNVGVAYTYRNLTFGVQYVDTDGSFITPLPDSKNASKAGIVGTVGVSF